jgi:hypothetical protein
MQQESLGKIQVLVSNTLIGVQVPASAPAMYRFPITFRLSAIRTALFATTLTKDFPTFFDMCKS